MNGAVADGEVCNGVGERPWTNTIPERRTLTNDSSTIVMGDIPAPNNMVSAIILSPAHGENLEPDQDFDIKLQVDNLAAGHFSNPQGTYFAAPQQLENGRILGHVHVTVQSLGDSLAAQRAPDPTTFAYFKGINDVGDGKGRLKATVTGGLPPGAYRVCTMVAATNHQPVLSPVSSRSLFNNRSDPLGLTCVSLLNAELKTTARNSQLARGMGTTEVRGETATVKVRLSRLISNRTLRLTRYSGSDGKNGFLEDIDAMIRRICESIGDGNSGRRRSLVSRRFIA